MQLSDTTAIRFPGLGIEVNPSDGFSIGSLEIKWYGVIIALGVLLAVLYVMRRVKEFGLTEDDIVNILLIGLPCAIIGARAYYVLLEPDLFFGPENNWYDCINLRDGGLAIYGGVIGAAIATLLYTGKKRRAKLLPLLDLIALGLLIGQLVGRWGNFFNREAHGGVTDCLLRMELYEDGMWQAFHPTFLYESVWNLIGLIGLHIFSKHRRFDGEVVLGYVAWYGLGRTWIEGLRTDSLWIGSFRASQVLAAVSCLVATGLLLYFLLVRKPDKSRMLVNRLAAEADEPSEPITIPEKEDTDHE